MEILFLSQVLPYPLDAGPKTRAYYVLRHVSKQNAITLLAFSRPTDPPEAIDHLRQICQRVITVPMHRSRLRDGLALARSLAAGRSFIIARDDSLEMQTRVRRLLDEQTFDFIHSDQIWMAQYVLGLNVQTFKPSNVRTVLDQHNAAHLIPRRMAANTRNPLFRRFLDLEARRLAQYEARACQQFDHVIWVTKEDQESLERLNVGTFQRSTVIPICVDPSGVHSVHPLPVEPNILFVGGMHWPPNAEAMRWFVGEVLPRVRAQIPEVRFCLVGKQPLRELRSAEGVTATGYVEDLEPYWKQSRLVVAPLLAGGGMRVKILDAWAHGLPVVSTSIGAEGLIFENGENILIADSPLGFSEAILRILREPELAVKLGQRGRDWVESHYDWQHVYTAWDDIYQQKER